MKTRRSVVAVVLASLTTGCAGLFGTNPSDAPRYDVVIDMTNHQSETVHIQIDILGSSGTVYKNLSHNLDPNSEVEIRPFTDLRETERDQFEVIFTVDDREPVKVTAKMDACHGHINVIIRKDGVINAGQMVC